MKLFAKSSYQYKVTTKKRGEKINVDMLCTVSKTDFWCRIIKHFKMRTFAMNYGPIWYSAFILFCCCEM